MKRRAFVASLMTAGVLCAAAGMALAVSIGVGLAVLGGLSIIVALLLGDED